MDAVALKERMRLGRPVFGTWSHLPLVQVVEIIGSSGLDFIVFDLEHGPHSFAEMPALYCAAESRGVVPMTRVPGLESSSVLRCLDSGAKGIMVPHVDGLAKARRALAAMYYGDTAANRGIATLTRASSFGAVGERQHLGGANAGIVSCLMIEDRNGLAELDPICELPGLDVVFLGIYDLSQSLGYRGDLEEPAFLRVFEDAAARVRAKGVAVGCYASAPAGVRRLLDLGATVVTLNVDGGVLRGAYQAIADALAPFRQA